MKFEAKQRRQEFELQLRKLEMEHDLRMREVQVNVEQNGCVVKHCVVRQLHKLMNNLWMMYVCIVRIRK